MDAIEGFMEEQGFVYFPVLRWKQGEQAALRRLDPVDRAPMLPVLEVQLLEQGVAQPKLTRSLELSKVDAYPVGVDLKPAYTSPVPLLALARLTASLQSAGLAAWPVVHAADALLDIAGLGHFKDGPALILRVYPNETLLATTISLIGAIRKACGKSTRIYVVLDMDGIGEIALPALAGMLQPFVQGITLSGVVTQVAAVGGSFPYSLGGFKVGVGTRLPRKELEVWKLLRALPGSNEVRFGDYGVTNPKPLEDIDPRAMNPAAAIRYALKDVWWLLRASGVRSLGKGGMGQYNDLCRLLTMSADYSGPTFSFGDHQYNVHAQPGATSGSFMTWRRDATSHHLVFTVRQLITGNV